MPLITSGAVANAIAQHSDDPFLIRMTVTHVTLADPIYVVQNRKNITTGDGREFVAFPFRISLPNSDDQQPSLKVAVANVDRSIGQALEAMVTPADFTIEIFLASDPDTVECSYSGFSMTDAAWGFDVVTMTVQRLSYWNEPWPRKTIRPSKYKGLVP